MKTKQLLTVLVVALLTLSTQKTNAQVVGVCICPTWVFLNHTPCEIEITAETPPPCVVQIGLTPIPANSNLPVTRTVPCIITDCGEVCPWAVRVHNSNFSMGGPDPNGTIYNNVMECAGCPTGWVKAIYHVYPGGSGYELRFECE